MLKRLDLEEFEHNTGMRHEDFFSGWDKVRLVVSLRELIRVREIRVMPMEYLKQILSSVTLAGDSNIRPYEGAIITTARIDPSILLVGQTFVERKKYQSLIEMFSTFFDGFCTTKGVAKCTALIVYGELVDGTLALAHYLPPIVEQGERKILLDGMHRNFLVMRVGTTLETIIVSGVKVPFPCTPQMWEKVVVVEEKPPREKRYFDLHPDLFRQLERVGIDG